MKKKVLSIFIALVLVLSFSLVTAVPVVAQGQVENLDTEETFTTIQDAIDDADTIDGHTIEVGAGNWFGAVVTKAVEIKGEDGAVIDGGPVHSSQRIQGFRLLAEGSGATISHLTFEVDLPIMAWRANDVTVKHCTMISPMQGISNWEGNGWVISQNVINGLVTDNGGGIGIFIGCLFGDTADDNLVAHNKIAGQIVVPEGEGGGYSGPGICLMSDRRGSRSGGTISGNRILHNKVSLSSTNPDLVWATGIELTDMGLEEATPIDDLTDNKVGFNDVRGVDGTPIALNPEEVADNNKISRNLGDDTNNRGQGLHPQVLFR